VIAVTGTAKVKTVKYKTVTSSAQREVQAILRTERADMLSERELEMLKLRFGLDGPPLTLQAIADQYGLTRERVRQVINKALESLGNDPWDQLENGPWE
jgi:DNA-directed RNA polymerase sigma subunit (sigma70/sigma32)